MENLETIEGISRTNGPEFVYWDEFTHSPIDWKGFRRQKPHTWPSVLCQAYIKTSSLMTKSLLIFQWTPLRIHLRLGHGERVNEIQRGKEKNSLIGLEKTINNAFKADRMIFRRKIISIHHFFYLFRRYI